MAKTSYLASHKRSQGEKMSAVITKSIIKNAYERNIDERRAVVAQITSEYSRKYFNHSEASIREIRFEAARKNLESIFSHS